MKDGGEGVGSSWKDGPLPERVHCWRWRESKLFWLSACTKHVHETKFIIHLLRRCCLAPALWGRFVKPAWLKGRCLFQLRTNLFSLRGLFGCFLTSEKAKCFSFQFCSLFGVSTDFSIASSYVLIPTTIPSSRQTCTSSHMLQPADYSSEL